MFQNICGFISIENNNISTGCILAVYFFLTKILLNFCSKDSMGLGKTL